MIKIKPAQLDKSVIEIIGKEWLLISAGSKTKFNSMTASWGTIGYMFNTDVAMIVVRPTRYTREFIDNESHFTLTILKEGYREALMAMGRLSGRECDKIQKAGLTPAFTESGLPTFEEARIVLECRKIFSQPMSESSFIDHELVDKWYDEAHGEFHNIYIGEIVNCWIKGGDSTPAGM